MSNRATRARTAPLGSASPKKGEPSLRRRELALRAFASASFAKRQTLARDEEQAFAQTELRPSSPNEHGFGVRGSGSRDDYHSMSSKAAPPSVGGVTDVSAPVIDVRGLRKSYDDHEVVRGIDLEVQHGEVFAFLGPNGAGKTTTVEILEGYRSRDAGEVRCARQRPGRRRSPLALADRPGAAVVHNARRADGRRARRAVRRLLPPPSPSDADD